MTSYSSRFWLYAPTGLFALFAIVVMAQWKFAANGFEKKLTALKGHEAIPGIVLNWNTVTVSGFPFRLDADFQGFSVRGAGARGPFTWTSAKFALHTLSYTRAKTVYEASGHQQLDWVDARGPRHADFLPASLHAGSATDDKGLGRFDVDIIDAGGNGFTAAELQLHVRRDPNGKNLDVMIQGDRVNDHPKIQAYVTLRNASALMPLLAGQTRWPDAINAWRTQGGQAHLDKGVETDLALQALSALY